jgi:hypothetical protein
MIREKRERSARLCTWMQTTAIAFLLLPAGFVSSNPSQAQPASLDGSWSGGGSVSFGSGKSERARCRAQYRRLSSTSYSLSATCATASGRASQTATLHHVGGNRFQGSFHNAEYGVSGTIYVTVGGNRQSVRLTADAGSASIELRR